MSFTNPGNNLSIISKARDRPSPYEPSRVARDRIVLYEPSRLGAISVARDRPSPYEPSRVVRDRFCDGDGCDETRGSIRLSFQCGEQFCDAHLVGGILACPTF